MKRLVLVLAIVALMAFAVAPAAYAGTHSLFPQKTVMVNPGQPEEDCWNFTRLTCYQ